jgi:hypothetical protein
VVRSSCTLPVRIFRGVDGNVDLPRKDSVPIGYVYRVNTMGQSPVQGSIDEPEK